MSTDLGDLWVRQNIEKAKKELFETKLAYEVLKDKRTTYAIDLRRIIKARSNVVQIWAEA
jgi:hypothetical protein